MALDPSTSHERFSDYIIFVDESGDHGLDGIDPQFPMFALSFCVIAKIGYANTIVPAFQQFKFDFWGHDSVILHEHSIRKSVGPFGVLLTDPALRERFYGRLNGLMANAPMSVIASVINKTNLKNRYSRPWSPYELALLFCMERGLRWLLDQFVNALNHPSSTSLRAEGEAIHQPSPEGWLRLGKRVTRQSLSLWLLDCRVASLLAMTNWAPCFNMITKCSSPTL